MRSADPARVRNLQSKGVPPLAATVLAAREIEDPQTLLGGSDERIPGVRGGEAAAAAQAIADAVLAKSRIALICSADPDGICAAAILSSSLKQLGARFKVHFCKRSAAGSLSPQDIDLAAKFRTKLIVSACCGISSPAAAARAQDRGVDLVIADHRKPPAQRPDCTAIACPQLEASGLPGRHLCGSAVALMLMREAARRCGSRASLDHQLDLAAVATIAANVPMDDDLNQRIVAEGLHLIRQGRCRVGVKAILGFVGVSDTTTASFTHSLIPTINAAGGFDLPDRALACLSVDDYGEGKVLAQELACFNRNRRYQTADILAEAHEHAERSELPYVLAFGKGWHPISLSEAAGKLAADLHKPAIVMAQPDGILRGAMSSGPRPSARAILESIVGSKPELLADCSGHRSSVSFTVRASFDEFAAALASAYASASQGAQLPDAPQADAEPTPDDLRDGSIEYLAPLPWGRNLPQPLFAGTFKLLDLRSAASGNGFNHFVEIGGSNTLAWHHNALGDPGEKLRMLYSTSPVRRSTYLPTLFVKACSVVRE